jgi:serine-type anaerobic sulfatase-maturating enzyme
MNLVGSLPILQSGSQLGASFTSIPRIESLLIKPASAVCNLDCEYCFYLDRDADPYKDLPARRMTLDTLERLVESYLAYSYPHSSFIFQGGEPTLAGLPYFQKLVEFQTQYGRKGQVVSNALQTNAVLLDEDWCQLFRDYNWFLGVSLDGPEPMHDRYRYNKSGAGSWKQVMQSVALLQKHSVPFNILCVVSQANVDHAAEVYRFFKSQGVDNLQFIPLAEFDASGNPLPFALTPQQYGKFLVDLYEAWQPDRRTMHIRFFDNIQEALSGRKPSTCTMHETCDSYVVVEYNGDVFPCDFFVEKPWKLGNIMADSWGAIASKPRRMNFASKKTVPHAECQVCEYQHLCHGGCPKLRTAQHQNFEDLDYFCQSYKTIFAKFKP